MTFGGAQQVIVRINGVLPDISEIGDEAKSARAAEVKREGVLANTSCSIFAKSTADTFHLLVDIGAGVVESIKNGIKDLGLVDKVVPDALLVTHAHEDHINDLQSLFSLASGAGHKLKIYCTKECKDQITKRHSVPGEHSFIVVEHGSRLDIGPFSVVPISVIHDPTGADHGSVIYVIISDGVKIIAGWDFLSLPEEDFDLLWNPDLLILGTQTYNDHPSTGMISVSEAYGLVRRWNAKECYIVHYSGLKDFDDAINQWFRGPKRAMTSNELQKSIDDHLQVTGDNGRFRMIVARQGMIWRPLAKSEEVAKGTIRIESLQKYIMQLDNTGGKLGLIIEDTTHRLSLEFVNPRKTGHGTLWADPVKGLMMKGPQMEMSVIFEPAPAIKVNITRGKKPVFVQNILVSKKDAERMAAFIDKNFTSGSAE
jgi:L-ascorbate metabolism protein UlaG (beta-lactamase superfamily)